MASQGRVRVGKLNSFRFSVDIETRGRPPSDDQVDAFSDALSRLGVSAPRSATGPAGIGATFSVDVRGVKGSDAVTEATRLGGREV